MAIDNMPWKRLRMINLSVVLNLFIMADGTVECICYFLTCARLDSQFKLSSLHGPGYIKP